MNNGSIIFGGTPQITLTGGAQVTGKFNGINATTAGGVVFTAPIVDGTPPGASAPVAGAISFTGTSLFLATANTYSGGTSLNVTNALISSSTNVTSTGQILSGPFGTGVLNLVGGALATGGGTVLGQAVSSTGATLANPVYFTGPVTFTGSAPLTITQPVTLATTAAPVALTVNNSTTFSSPIGEIGIAHSLSMAGLGTLTLLSSNSTYSGGTTLATGGTLGAAGTLAFPGGRGPAQHDLGSARHRDPDSGQWRAPAQQCDHACQPGDDLGRSRQRAGDARGRQHHVHQPGPAQWAPTSS